MTEKGLVFSVNISSGGVPKLPVAEAMVTVNGVEGDRQRNLKHHGGPDRAVCIYSIERILALEEEGHPIAPGSVGENLTLSGIDWDNVGPDAMLEVGEALMEIVSFTPPCRTIRHSFREEKFSRLSQKHFPGWSRVYARVLREGLVREGDRAVLRDLP
ncbi:MAG TPA: MOSC domain-containing protein [Gemmatimonadaceae bacterium]|nr:MOSC domain-containing protein [Gemmatimonadaceae bacterium]